MDDPDWMNDFKSPTENVLLHLSSSSPSCSPSREPECKKGKSVGTEEEVSVSNGRDLSDDEDSPLISALKYGRAAKRGRKAITVNMSQEMERSPVKRAAKAVSKGALEDIFDEEESPKGNKKKRAQESEGEDDDVEVYQIPSKVRKTSASPQVKKATPKSSRKGRRVSFSEEEGAPQLKRVKREVPEATDEEDEEPISSPVRKKDKGPTDTAAAPKESRGETALASLSFPEVTAADAEDAFLTKDEAIHEEEAVEVSERKGKTRGSANLPVILAEKVHRTKVLLECEGDALDLSGDMGAVGRFSVSSGKEEDEDELFLDLKGIIYKTTIVPSNTFFVAYLRDSLSGAHAFFRVGNKPKGVERLLVQVNVGHAEAKVEAIMNDFMQLRPDINQVQDETLVEGTLEGYELDNDNDGEPLSTPVTAPGPGDSDADEDDTKKKKKTPTKPQKQKKVPGKGSRAKGSGKGATSKKPRAKAKATAKKPPKPKTTTAKSVKSKKS